MAFKKTSPDEGFLNRHILQCFAAPFQIEQYNTILFPERPRLSFTQDATASLINQIIDHFPANGFASFIDNSHRSIAVIVLGVIHEKVPAIHLFQSPVTPGLMPMMIRVDLG